MRLQSTALALVSAVGLWLLASSVAVSAVAAPDAVAADAAAEYEALQLAESDAAMDEHDELSAAGEHELSAHEAEALESTIDRAVDSAVEQADEMQANEEEVDADDLLMLETGTAAEAEAEAEAEFGPFQAAANVMPYNMAVDAGHNFMNPFIRGYNPAYDGYTPQPGGGRWNNPNGPYWSPFHWSAPASYWSVYPPQYASHYVSPRTYHAPRWRQFFGPNYYGGHKHVHGPDAVYPYGGVGMHSMDPHVFGPHLDWPFGALTSDIDHVPGMGTGVNPLQRFPQFIETAAEESEEDADEEEAEDNGEETEVSLADIDADAQRVDDGAFEVDATNHVIPRRSTCVNCAYSA